MKDIRIATRNSGKLREFRQMLEPHGYRVRGLEDLPDLEVIEDGDSFAQNAILKAETVMRVTGSAVLADDSGLEVEALGGAPGIHSARYAGVTNGDVDAANRHKLLGALAEVPPDGRQARFVCALAYVTPDEKPLVYEGELRGRIGFEELGNSGFGYDPIFELPERQKSLAQLDADEKNAISHRGRALAAFVTTLRD